jgi:hypothetical protein
MLGDQLVHAHHQHILVVRPVENNGLPFDGGAQEGAPRKVMRGCEPAGLLEAEDRCALGVHRAENVAYDVVLAARVECCTTISNDWLLNYAASQHRCVQADVDLDVLRCGAGIAYRGRAKEGAYAPGLEFRRQRAQHAPSLFVGFADAVCT